MSLLLLSKKEGLFAVNARMLEELLGFKEMRVEGVEVDAAQECLHVRLAYRDNRCDCPHCDGKRSAREKKRERRKNPVRHLDCFQYKTLLYVDSIEMCCAECGWLFNRRPSFLGDAHYVTEPLMKRLVTMSKDTSLSSWARWHDEPERTVSALYYRHLERADGRREIAQVRRLGIDEISLHKGQGNYAMLLYDLDRSEVIEVFPDRKKDTLIAYLTAHKDDVFAQLEAVSIDMWRHYKEGVLVVFPHVDVVADRFHVIKELNECLDDCRKAIQRTIADPDERKAFKQQSRHVLLRGYETQCARPDGESELKDVLALDGELARIYWLKEAFRDIYYCESYDIATKELDRWIRRADYLNSDYLNPFVETVKRWKPEILAYLRSYVTNATAEGFNCKVKLIKRLAYGFRNFANFRLRILHTCSKTLD